MLISLKRYLDTQAKPIDGLAAQLIHTLLTAVGKHAVEIVESELAEFRGEILRLDEKLLEVAGSSTPEYLVLLGATAERIENYGRRMTKVSKIHSAELRRMVEMLTNTVTSLSASDDASIQNLRALSKQIERTKEVEDLRVIKERLSDCLGLVEQEAVRRRSESAALMAKMKQELATTAERLNSGAVEGPARDALTGLCGREEAERFLVTAFENNPEGRVAVFVVQRLPLINSRFGYKAGDEVIQHFGVHLRDSAAAADKVFRWSGPSFVVWIDRQSSMIEVRRELAAISSHRLEKTLQAANRVAMVTVASAWTVFALRELKAADEISLKVDQFARVSTTVGDPVVSPL